MEINKLGLFNQIPQTQSVGFGKAREIGGDPTSGGGNPAASSGMFSGKTVGINDAVTGTQVFASGQVGKKPAVLGSSFQAIG